jgi:hypothetical protein
MITTATRTSTRENFNGTNPRILRRLDPADPSDDYAMLEPREEESRDGENASWRGVETAASPVESLAELLEIRGARSTQQADFTPIPPAHSANFLQKALKWIKIYGRFIGPGFMVGNL